jgi:hypothetical protein
MSEIAEATVRPRRRWIWILVALATSAVLVLPVTVRVGLKADLRHEQVRFRDYSASQVTAIEVSAPGASVTVRPVTAGRVTLASSESWLLTRPFVRPVRHGKTLTVSVGCPQLNPFEDCGVGLTIGVPASMRVQADVGAGSLSVSGLSGPLRVSATTGSITLTHDTGPVQVQATAGSISAFGLTSPRVSAAVRAGSLRLQFATAPQSLALAVGSGSGRVALPHGSSYRITSHGPGVLHVASGLAAPGSERLLTARVGGGMITLAYPAGTTPTRPDSASSAAPRTPAASG